MGSKQQQRRSLQYTKVVAIKSNISSVACLEMGIAKSLSCLCSQDLQTGVAQGSYQKPGWYFYTPPEHLGQAEGIREGTGIY